MLVKVDTVNVNVGTVKAGSVTTESLTATFTKYNNDAICIPVFLGAGWLTCSKFSISGNKLYVTFGNPYSGDHTGTATFAVLQFVKASS